MIQHDDDLPCIPQEETKQEEVKDPEQPLEPLPIVLLEEFFKLKKNKKTGAAKFTTEDRFVMIEWPAATAKLKLFMTEDKRTIIQGPEMMEEVGSEEL